MSLLNLPLEFDSFMCQIGWRSHTNTQYHFKNVDGFQLMFLIFYLFYTICYIILLNFKTID